MVLELYTVQSIMRTQNFLIGLGLGLGSQFIYLVGYEFPIKGSSLPGILTALFNPRKFLPSLIWVPLSGQYSLSLTLYFCSESPTPSLYSLPLFIAWGWWSVHDYVLVSLVWVGSNLIIPDKEYASLETVVIALELVLASNRVLGKDTPQGNTELPRSWVVPSKYIPDQSMPNRHGLVWHAIKWDGLTVRHELENVLRKHSGQGYTVQ